MDDYLIRDLETPCVFHDPEFLSEEQADSYYATLRKQIPWEKTAKINRWVRLYQEAGDDAKDAPAYAYKDAPQSSEHKNDNDETNNDNNNDNNDETNNDLHNVNGFPEHIQTLRKLCQDWYASKQENNHESGDTTTSTSEEPPAFNVCLLNFYEDGQQRIGWHSDREEIGRTTPIASVSLGAPRRFLIRSQTDGRRDRSSLQLRSGSLVVMEPSCQTKYLHSIPKEAEVTSGRINLTFRCKDFSAEAKETTEGEELHERRDHFLDKLIGEGTKPTTRAWTSGRDGDTAAAAGSSSGATASSSFVFGVEPSTPLDDELAPFELRFLVKTNMGAEGYCAAEIRERLSELEEDTSNWTVLTRPFDFDGYIGLFCPHEDDEDDEEHGYQDDWTLAVAVRNELLQLRTAHHVLKYQYHFRLRDCFPFVYQYNADADLETLKEERIPKEALYEHIKEQLLNNTVSFLPLSKDETDVRKMTFRVTSDRVGGPHAWQAPDVEYEIGGAFAEVYGDRHKWKPKMTDYDLHIRADVIGKLVVMGTQLNVHDLSKGRHFARYRNGVTIKTNLAYAMIRLANLKEGNTVLDPFCGSGTLLLEALEIFNGNLRNCLGMDVSRRSANGARDNAIAEGYHSNSTLRFVCSDARSLRRHVDADGSVDAVVSNLPWGIMTGQNQSVSSLQTLYEVFLRNAWYVLRDGGRVVMLVLRGLQVMRIVRKLSGRYKLVHANVVRTTNNLPSLIVIEKLPDDEIRDSLKGQLAHLNQYVNVSPEIYKCIHIEDVDDDYDNNKPRQQQQISNSNNTTS